MTKCLLPNQCAVLHLIYGQCDCCLCNALARIKELETQIEILKDTKRIEVDYGYDDGYKERMANPTT